MIATNNYITEKFNNVDQNLFSLDIGCDVVLEINKFDEHIYTRIEFATQSHPMEFSTVDVGDLILVNY